MDTKGIGPSQVKESVLEKLQKNNAKVGTASSRTDRSNPKKADYKVNLSDGARELSQAQKKALDIAMKTDPVRQSRVAELQKKIKAGEYVIDSGKVADGILVEAVRDRLAMEDDPS